jgi:hypothetical protein
VGHDAVLLRQKRPEHDSNYCRPGELKRQGQIQIQIQIQNQIQNQRQRQNQVDSHHLHLLGDSEPFANLLKIALVSLP